MHSSDDTVVKANPINALPGSIEPPPVATMLSAHPPGLSGGVQEQQWEAPPGGTSPPTGVYYPSGGSHTPTWSQPPGVPAPYPGMMYGGGSQVPSWSQPVGTYGGGGPQVLVVSDWEISQMDLVRGQGDTMGKEFLSYGICMSLFTAGFSCLALLMATLGQGLPWILLPLPELSMNDCVLAIGLTNFGYQGGGCPNPIGTTAGVVPPWPKPLSDPSARGFFTGSFTGGTTASSCLGGGAIFYFLCIMCVGIPTNPSPFVPLGCLPHCFSTSASSCTFPSFPPPK